MKKWISVLVYLGYLTPAFGTAHDSFLVTGDELQEISNFPNYLQTPNFFTQVYPENINPNLVLVTRTNRGFEFGITGYYQRFFDNQTDYAIVDFGTPFGAPFFAPSLTSSVKAIAPDYHIGYGAYVGYVFPYTGKDLYFDIAFMNGARTDSVDRPAHGTLWAPLPLYDRTVQAREILSRYSTNVERARLLMGENIRPGTRFRLHPSFGAKYAGINRRLTTSHLDAASILQASFGNSVVTEKSQFRGLGPAVQFDGTYFFVPHLGITAHALTGVLVGGMRSSIRVAEGLTAPPVDIVSAGLTQINHNRTTRAVPNIDGKLGLVYEYPFCNSLMKLEFELGYQFDHYFNAVDTYRSAGSVVSVTTNGLTTYLDTPLHIKHPHDFTIDGPYLSFGIAGISCPNNPVIDPVCVSVPRQEGGFVFGIGPLFYRVQTNQQDYVILDPVPLNIAVLNPLFPRPLLLPSPQRSSLKPLNGNNAGGFMLTLGYIFGDSPYDVTAHAESASTNRGKKNKNNPTTTMTTTDFNWPILAVPFLNGTENRLLASNSTVKSKFTYGELHLDIGQAINAGSLFFARVFEGIEFVHIKQDFTVTYSNLTTNAVFPSTGSTLVPIPIFFPQEQVTQDSRFTGIGPRIGIDLGMPLGSLALVSELATGCLLGRTDASYRDEYAPGFLPNPILGGVPIPVIPVNSLGTKIESEKPFSPFIDVKVAIAYTWNFFFGTKWTVELGYKAVHYFNSVTTFRHVTNNAAVFVKQVGDATFDGPYLNFTVFGFGACPPDCVVKEPFCVYVPELKGGFELGLEWLNAKPHVTNIDFGILDPSPTVVPIVSTALVPGAPLTVFSRGIPLNPSPNSSMQVLEPRSHGAARIHIGYIFPLTSNDISINLTHFREEEAKFILARSPGVVWTITNGNFGAQSLIGQTFFPVLANRADVSAKLKWKASNLEFGKRVKFYQLMTRFFAGFAFAKIDENISIVYREGLTNFLNPTPTFVPFDTIVQNNQFKGVGPRLGAAGDLSLGCGFSLTGQVATDLLIGKFNGLFAEGSSFGQVAVLDPDRRTRFAPEIEGKFGFAYTVALKNCSQVGLEVGYSVNHYFNVKDSLRFTDSVATFVKQDQDIGFEGPFVRLQINF